MMLVADITPATKASAKAASASSGELLGNMGLLGLVVGQEKKPVFRPGTRVLMHKKTSAKAGLLKRSGCRRFME